MPLTPCTHACMQDELDLAQAQLNLTQGRLGRAHAQLARCAGAYAEQVQRTVNAGLLLRCLLEWGTFVRSSRQLQRKEQQAVAWSTQHRLKRRCGGPGMRLCGGVSWGLGAVRGAITKRTAACLACV